MAESGRLVCSISLSLACRSGSAAAPSVVLWFWDGAFSFFFFFFMFWVGEAPVTGSRLSHRGAGTRVYAPCMQMHPHACLHTLTSEASHAVLLRAGRSGARTLAFTQALASHLLTRPSCTSHINSLASVTVRGGGCVTHTPPHTHAHEAACRHANTYTPRHMAQSCCLQPA